MLKQSWELTPFRGFFFPCFFSEWATLSLVKVYDEFREFHLHKTFIILYPSVHVNLLSLDAFRIRGLLCGVVDIWNLETPKPEIPKCFPTSFHLSKIWELLCVVVWWLQTPKPWIPKSRSVGPTSFHFLEFGSCSVFLFGSCKPRNPESLNPEVLVPHPFTFQNSGVVVCCCLVVANPENPNPKILKCWSHILSPFEIQEL